MGYENKVSSFRKKKLWVEKEGLRTGQRHRARVSSWCSLSLGMSTCLYGLPLFSGNDENKRKPFSIIRQKIRIVFQNLFCVFLGNKTSNVYCIVLCFQYTKNSFTILYRTAPKSLFNVHPSQSISPFSVICCK